MNFDFRSNTDKCDLIMQPPVQAIQGAGTKLEFRIGSK